MRDHKGFTIIEMIMVIILVGIISAVIAIPLLQGVKGWFQATTREGISQSGRIAIERISREIRNTAKKTDKTACISTATSTSFVFSNQSGNLTDCNSITFCQSSDQSACTGSGSYLIRIDTTGSATLADNIQSLTFTYYNSGNAVAASAASTSRVQIEIVSIQGGETMRQYTVAYLLNQTSFNVALRATATASTEASGQTAVKAIDGVVSGYPVDYTKEWASNGQGSGAWLRLDWTSSYLVDRIIIYDRPNTDDQVLSATITFSDSSTQAVGTLTNDSTGVEYTFTPRYITYLTFTVNTVSGTTVNIGLSEIEVYGQ